MFKVAVRQILPFNEFVTQGVREFLGLRLWLTRGRYVTTETEEMNPGIRETTDGKLSLGGQRKDRTSLLCWPWSLVLFINPINVRPIVRQNPVLLLCEIHRPKPCRCLGFLTRIYDFHSVHIHPVTIPIS